MNTIKATIQKVPTVVWLIICISVAIFYSIVWPADANPGDPGSLRYIILRWFHPLAWVILATACLVSIFAKGRAKSFSRYVALLALPTYAAFFLAVAISFRVA